MPGGAGLGPEAAGEGEGSLERVSLSREQAPAEASRERHSGVLEVGCPSATILSPALGEGERMQPWRVPDLSRERRSQEGS